MKPRTSRLFMILGILILAGEGCVWAQTAEEIVVQVLNILAPGEWKGQYLFTNHRTDGSSSTYTLNVMAKQRNLIHLTFLAPAREAGRQILNKNGEIWSYLPDSRKIIRLADRESLANGDFNNADVMKLNWSDDYTATLAKESPHQLVIELQAKPDKNPTYFHMRLWLHRESLQPIQQYFFDETGHHLKTLKYRKIRSFGEITRPSELIMENVVTGQKTVLQIMEFTPARHLPRERFSQENLGK